jgi:hypothetical protein
MIKEVQETHLLPGVWGCPPILFKSPKVWGTNRGFGNHLPSRPLITSLNNHQRGIEVCKKAFVYGIFLTVIFSEEVRVERVLKR